jgi:AraC family transcriptional regulator of adaptative response/methylated-DNA-[protein]-cysteine methyltransferase
MQAPGLVAGLSEAELWRAVQTRDHLCDRKFVFGVLSTHIYCRPSCPSRRPRRDRVVFFAEPVEAEASGFRACARCKPDDDSFVNPRMRLIRAASSYLEDHRGTRVTLVQLGKAVGASPLHVQRTFKEILGITPKEFSEELELGTARFSLREGESVRRSTYSSGHSSTAWLYSGGRSKLGMRPGDYKSGGAGLTIHYAAARCGLGWVMVGETEKGVCSVSLGDSADELRRYIAHEFPRAQLVDDEGELSHSLKRITLYLDGAKAVDLSDLPLNIRATSFQHRVWKELQRIPYGHTSTYGEIAKKIGSPSAVRAVANACAANPVAMVVPCHRVIRGDGSLGGYKWGLDRKRALIAKEAELGKSIAPTDSQQGVRGHN